MTFYVNLRAGAVGGAVVDPYVIEGDGTKVPPALKYVEARTLPARVAGKDILFGVHGFNVSYGNGASELGWLDNALRLSPPELFFGVLWPGDFWLPVINYPFEGATSIDSGRRLAEFCNRWFDQARSISFLSHSLGARLVLEAITNLDRAVESVCLTAGAINHDCLTSEYALALTKITAVTTLASRNDLVLKLAFPVGDLISDVLHADHIPLRRALGYDGPHPLAGPSVTPSQISDAAGYGHGDYLPPPSATQPVGGKWPLVADFMACSFRKTRPAWP